MTAREIVAALKPLGTEGYRRVLRNHGVPEPMFGVKISDLKTIVKRVGTDHALALDLYATGIYDARYLAGLVADDAKMTKKNLRDWARQANCDALTYFTVPWVAAGSPHGWELGLEWIEAKQEGVAAAGWSTLGSLAGIRDDADLDRAALRRLLQRVGRSLHDQPNSVRYAMNGFVIAVGGAVTSLTATALATAAKVGTVNVSMGNTECKVPDAATYIRAIEARGALGRKRTSAKC